MAALLMWPRYVRAHRIRAWGRLPVPRGPTLCVVNHQHDLDDQITVAYLARGGPLNKTICAVTSRRLFERGALAWPFPWLEPVLRTADASKLFSLVGMLPIENEISERPLTSFARAVLSRHGDLPLARVFKEPALAALAADVREKHLSDVFAPTFFRTARGTSVRAKWIFEPYRSELFAQLRDDIETDMRALEARLRSGATIWLTPEGRFSRSGRMGALRTALWRLAPLAEQIYTIAISYDVFVGRRVSMLFRVIPALNRADLANSMNAARPVTVSQLLADWLCGTGLSQLAASRPFSVREARAAVTSRLALLPALAWIDPELRASPERLTAAALDGLLWRGIVRRHGDGYELTDKRDDALFPKTRDVIAHQAAFFEESSAAWRALDVRKG
ncbi:MAG: hypothetical protein JO194_11790 [Candidatus Eremiobacteraeota bacterium]|nr:hypothetical protein [Candidatus Eremiobacteraeota bacterium]